MCDAFYDSRAKFVFREMDAPQDGVVDRIEVSDDLRYVAVKIVPKTLGQNETKNISTSVRLYSLNKGNLLSSFDAIPFSFSQMSFLPGGRKLALVSFQQIFILSISSKGELAFLSQTNLPRYVINRIGCVGNYIVRYVSDQVCIWTIEPFSMVVQMCSVSALSVHYDRFRNIFYFKTFRDGAYKLVSLNMNTLSPKPKSQKFEEVCELDSRPVSLAFCQNNSALGIISESHVELIDLPSRKRLRSFDLSNSKGPTQFSSTSMYKCPSSVLPEMINFTFYGPKRHLEISDNSSSEIEALKFHNIPGVFSQLLECKVRIYKPLNLRDGKNFSTEVSGRNNIIKFSHRPPRGKTSNSFRLAA